MSLPAARLPKIAVLIDLPRSPLSGGHVKGWERRARAAVKADLPVDLTIYFSGPAKTEILSEKVRLRQLPPVFSTSRLKFLPYMPDATDLAPFHPALAEELQHFDLIHTTDAYFNFSKTAIKIAAKHGIPLITSLHTDTPGYTRIFTRKTIESLFGKGWFSRLLNDTFAFPEREGRKMDEKLRRHILAARHAIVSRIEDRDLTQNLLGPANVTYLKACSDKEMFSPARRDRAGVEKDYGIPSGKIIGVFSGRVDIGKNIYTLIEAAEKVLEEGLPFHLIVAGVGPATEDVKTRLKENVTLAGFVDPHEMGRLYASADFVTLPSEVEIRSFVTVEGLISGTPVLVSEKSNIAPLFHNTPALDVVTGGPSSWAGALRTIIQNTEKRKAMADAASAYSDEHILTWEQSLTTDFLPVWLGLAKKG